MRVRLRTMVSGTVVGAILLGCGEDIGPIDPALDPISVLRVDVSPAVDTIFAGDTIRPTDRLQLSAQVIGRLGPIQSAKVIWLGETPEIATVSETGLVTPRQFGTARIVASAGKQAIATVVIAPAAARIEVTPSLDTLLVKDPIVPGDIRQLSARALDRDGQVVAGTRLVWTSSNPAVATVDSTGRVTAIALGSTTIAAAAPSAGVSGSATFVVAPRVRRVEVTPASDSIFVENPIVAADVLQLAARALEEDGALVTGTRITWTSGNPAVAAVSDQGLVRAVSLGSTTITARSSNASGSTTVTIVPVLKSITVTSPVNEALALDTVQLTASAFDYSDRAVSGRTFAWISSNPAIAAVDQSGRVIAAAPGTVTFTASGAFRSASVTVTFLERRLLNVSAGGDFSCGTTPLGRLYCWGRGDLGQLASASDSLCFDLDPDVTKLIGCTLAPKRTDAAAVRFRTVSAGGSFGCGVETEGRLYCWGNDQYGQIGNGATADGGPVPQLATVGSVRFDSVSAGLFHACALTATGTAYCWGSDSLGQLGDRRTVNSTTPIPVFGSTTFRSISAGGYHTCGVRTDGQAVCWGDNRRGQLGNGTIGGYVDQPEGIVPGGPYTTISAGLFHTCAVSSGGQALCWGDNAHGQLGVGTRGDTLATPTPVAASLTFTRIAAGGYLVQDPVFGNLEDGPLLPIRSRSHTCALTAAGAAYCWGDNFWRQSGIEGGSVTTVTIPNLVPGQPAGGFTTISTGFRHACAFGANGQTWCWGSNVHGALGNELQAAGRHTPQLVARPR